MTANPLNFLLSPLLSAVGVVKQPKAPKIPMTPPPAQSQTNTAVLDAVARRQGSRANQRSGRGGAEASEGRKTSLGA